MAHFAELDKNNKVIRVLVFSNDIVNNNGGDLSIQAENYILNTTPFTSSENSVTGNNGVKWKQTSYNGNFRKQFASINYSYDSTKDKFISIQPYPSWTLDSNDDWKSPIIKPTVEECTYIYNGQNRLYKVDWIENIQKWRGLKQEDYEENGSNNIYYWNSINNNWELA